MREHGEQSNDLVARLADDERLGLPRDRLEALVTDPLTFTGAAGGQVDAVVARIERIVAEHPSAASYQPGAIL